VFAAAALLPVQPAAAVAAPKTTLPSAHRALEAAEQLADWQLARLGSANYISRQTGETANPRAWEQGAFWLALARLAERSRAPRFREAVIGMGRASNWQPGPRLYHADDHVIGQSYLWAARNGAGPAAVAPIRAAFDRILAQPPQVHLSFYFTEKTGGYESAECLKRWCWCDALFMAPATWIGLSRQTGDRRYRDYAVKELWATTDFLFDPAERLFFRDSRFFERREANGRKQFWSRGNGWVLAGLALTLEQMAPDDPDRRRVEQLFRTMAERIRGLQKPDGYWPPSLLHPEGSPPESSGTGFYTFALAWGIGNGLLDRRVYEASARQGWAALERSIQPDGRLGWVQQVSDRPEQVLASDTQFYGVGAFLLAATAIAELDQPRRGLRR